MNYKILFIFFSSFFIIFSNITIIATNNNLEVNQFKLLPSDGTTDDYFGMSVSIDGDYAIVGSYLDDDNGDESGSAYIFKREGSNWIEQTKILASDGESHDLFGHAVSISGDYVIIGADEDDDNGPISGSAYIFKREGSNWIEQKKLLASDGLPNDLFGLSVGIDGDYAIIGAHYRDDNGPKSGCAYIFKREGTDWIEEAKLLPSDGDHIDFFGFCVSISGSYAIMGAHGNDDNDYQSGSAYIFNREGTTWSQQAKLLPSDGALGDKFGESVSISGDYAIISGHHNDDNGADSGSAYIFKREGTEWIEQTKLLPSDGESGHSFGVSVSIDDDYAVIGAFIDDDNGANSGSAYIFKREGTEWIQQSKLLAFDGENDDNFGHFISIEGDYAIIGAGGDDDKGSNSGSAYIFIKEDSENQPPNIPNKPAGEKEVGVGISYSYYSGTIDPNDDDVKLGWDWDSDEIVDEWTDYIPSDETVTVWHSWDSVGIYNIKVKAQDNRGMISNFSTPLTVNIIDIDNNPPNKPTITGPNIGIPGKDYDFIINSIDPDNDNLQFYIEWGDSNEWTEFVSSGEDITLNHSWTEKNQYTIRVKSKDINDEESEWTILEIKISKTKSLDIRNLLINFFEEYSNVFPILRKLFE